MSYGVINDLSMNVMQAAIHTQSWAFGRALNLLAKAQVTTIPCFSPIKFGHLSHHPYCKLLSLTSLTGLSADPLTFVANTLAKIWLRTTELANVSSCLAHKLFINTSNGDFSGGRDIDFNPWRWIHFNRMRVAQGQY